MRGGHKKTIVIVPVYTTELSETEKKSIKHNLDVLAQFQFAIVKPASLRLDFEKMGLTSAYLSRINVQEFDDNFFSSVEGYNRLLLSSFFYERFHEYEYMLICQLDAFIFRNELDLWVAKKYDYIGAPWTEKESGLLLSTLLVGKLRWMRGVITVNKILFRKKDFMIGNGGLSLRNIRKSILALKRCRVFASRWKQNEDLFWSIIVPIVFPFFKIPSLKEGLGFAIEKNPEYFFSKNGNKLPFGCHAWEKHNPSFWSQYITQ